jgi:hypothetical protein
MDRITLGPEFLKEMEQAMVNIRKNTKWLMTENKAMKTTRGLTESSKWGIMCISK